MAKVRGWQAIAAVLGGCAAEPAREPAAVPVFCDRVAELGGVERIAGGGLGESGRLVVRVLGPAASPPDDPAWVGDLPFVLENREVGGPALSGLTDARGGVERLLGAGQWAFRVAVDDGRRRCAAEALVELAAGETTQLCLDPGCG